jgi:uncharacterized SAM-binding protein YcdF (DUF218 family)
MPTRPVSRSERGDAVTWWSREHVIRVSVRRGARAAALCAVIGIVTLTLTYAARAPLLTWVGGLLVWEDPLRPAGAIVVLAGATPGREIEAARLYGEGLAPRVVLPRSPEAAGAPLLRELGITTKGLYDLRLDVLRALDVADGAIVRLIPTVDSTAEEAEAVVAWAKRNQVASLIVVTSRFHTRRVRLTYDRVAASRGIDVMVHPVDRDGGFEPDTWWRSRTSLRTGLYELQKLLFYQLTYRG